MTDDPVRIVDASAVCAMLFAERDGDVVAGRFAGARLVAPHLLEFEVASVALKKLRLHPELSQRLAAHGGLVALFDLLDDLAIELVPVSQAEIVQLAATTGLTTYDASYLWLARHLGAELVTLDRKLAVAAATI